jgi:hypothetical protein
MTLQRENRLYKTNNKDIWYDMHLSLGRETESRSGLRFRRMFGEEATTG